MSSRPAPPLRGTRPRNRRALILAAATELLYERGYSRVGMADIAEAVAISPSALYRHFSGKQRLLGEVVLGTMAEIRELVVSLEGADRTTWLPAMAAMALDNRRIGVLWRREARHLDAADRLRMRRELDAIRGRLRALVLAARPDSGAEAAGLRAWFLPAVLLSVSFHRLSLPRADFEPLLTELAGTVLDVAIPAGGEPAAEAPGRGGRLVPRSRREALLVEATRMFADRGYAEVSIDDVGARLGLTGAAIYHHFPTKLAMLESAFQRGNEWLWADLTQTLGLAGDPADALRGLVRSYSSFAVHSPDWVNLLLTETPQLPEPRRRQAHLAQRAYLDEWVHLGLAVHPGLDPAVARVRVHAVLTSANQLARDRRLRQHPDALSALHTIGDALLGLPVGGGAR